MMPTWKKNIFINVIRQKIEQEGRSAEDAIQEYTKLTAEEKDEILAGF